MNQKVTLYVLLSFIFYLGSPAPGPVWWDDVKVFVEDNIVESIKDVDWEGIGLDIHDWVDKKIVQELKSVDWDAIGDGVVDFLAEASSKTIAGTYCGTKCIHNHYDSQSNLKACFDACG